jgi:hypothetical protein
MTSATSSDVLFCARALIPILRAREAATTAARDDVAFNQAGQRGAAMEFRDMTEFARTEIASRHCFRLHRRRPRHASQGLWAYCPADPPTAG